MERCGYCGLEIDLDANDAWADSSGDVACPFRAGDDPHIPAEER